MRSLLFLLRPEATRLTAATTALLVSTTAGLLFPQIIRQMIDGEGAFGGSLSHFVLAALALALAQSIAGYFRTSLFTLVGVNVVARLRKKLFWSLLHMPMGHIDQRSSGALTSRLSNDAGEVQDALSVTIGHALRHGTTVVGALALMAWMAPKLTVAALVLLPTMVVIARLHGRIVRRLGTDGSDALAHSSEIAVEQLRQMATVRTLQAESHAAQAYDTAVESVRNVGTARAYAAGRFAATAAFSRFGGLAAIIAIGIDETRAGLLTMGDLGAFVVYTMLFAVSIGELASLWAGLSVARGACVRVGEWLQTQGEDNSGTSPKAGTIEMRGVHFRYPSRTEHPVLNGVNLTIERGQTVAVVGPSGAGKSTLAHLLTKLYDVESGTITWGGIDLKACSPSEIRSRIGLVSQEPVLFSGSIADNIRLGRPNASDEDLWAAAEAAMVLPIVARMPGGFDADVGEGGRQLSGGEKQRVAIARALLADPELLILDEATSALDTLSEAKVAAALERLMEGRSTLIITHRMDQAARADHVVVLDSGRVIEAGSPAKLLSNNGPFQKMSTNPTAGGNSVSAAPLNECGGSHDSSVFSPRHHRPGDSLSSH
jgi:ATP-binding cassette subfamily B protein